MIWMSIECLLIRKTVMYIITMKWDWHPTPF